MFDLKPLFFVVCRLTAHFFALSRSATRTVSRNEKDISWECCPRHFRTGHLKKFFPETIPGGCSINHLVS